MDTVTALALSVTINAGGTLQSPLAGAITTNNLTAGGTVINNGILDLSTNGNTSAATLTFGATDIPAPADFDGDGSTDIVIFRPSTGDWHRLLSSNGTTDGLHWGIAEDIPIPSRIIYDDGLSALTQPIQKTDLSEKP